MVSQEKDISAHDEPRWPVPVIALSLGVLSVVGALAICLLTFFSTIDSAERQLQLFYMDTAQAMAVEVAGHPELSNSEMLDLLHHNWDLVSGRPSDKYMLVVDESGAVLLHTLNSQEIGQNVGKNRILGNRSCEPCTLDEILVTHEDYLGGYQCRSGQEQIAAFVYAPSRQWMIGVHRSRKILRQEILASLSSLLGAMIIVCGLLIPISLFLLYRTFCIAHRRERQIKEALHKSQEQFRSVVEDLPVMICRIKPDGTIIVANQIYCDHLHKTHQQVIGASLFELLPESIAQQVRDDLAKVTPEHPKRVDEYKMFDPTGIARHLRWTVRGIFNETGQIVMYQAFGEDITEVQKSHRERDELLAMLDAKNKELQSLVYISSHDLKTPLVNIAGFSGMLKDHCRELDELLSDLEMDSEIRRKLQLLLHEDVREDLDFIRSGVRQVQTLLDGLLRVSRVGTAEIMPQRLNMNHVLSEITDMVRFQCEEKQATIEVDELPDCVCDLNQAHQVFTNLIDNALKYLDPQRKGRIHVTGQVRGETVVYCVEDNGIGIEERYQQKVFDIYYRLDPTGSIEGEGLGLVIIRRILDRYSGKIWLESKLGKGSQFYVSLPHKESS